MSDGNAVDKLSCALCCASCGIAEIDELKLMECADCDLVRYCSDGCQREHKLQHEEACKKRAAELRDELLFKQPESTDLGDCPICCLPLPLDRSTKSIVASCCTKVICNGCNYANQKREFEGKLERKCVFCRKVLTFSNEENDKQRMKRIEANDPIAMYQEGFKQDGKGDYTTAFECFTKSAESGYAEAHSRLSLLYRCGKGVEKDKVKEIYHMEEAAIGGHPDARYNLGCEEEECGGNIERAVKHFIISANLGDDDSIKTLMEYFKEGFVSKDDLAATLRAHQAAVDATKSPQRDAAEEYY